MCDPATAMVVASTLVSVGGTAYGGMAARNETRYSSQVATNNAAVSRNQAADAIERGNRETQRKWREVAALKSSQIAAAAANGLDTSFGSIADVVSDTAVFGAMDAQTIQEGAAREATGFMISAQNYEEEAKAQRRQGRSALISAGLQATGTILGGASQIKGFQPTRSSFVQTSTGPVGRSGWGGSSAPNSAFKW